MANKIFLDPKIKINKSTTTKLKLKIIQYRRIVTDHYLPASFSNIIGLNINFNI
jgi:hypothetical protein